MTRLLTLASACLGLASTAFAQCGSGAEGIVDGSGNSFTAVVNGGEVYAGSNYLEAIQTAVDSIAPGERVAVLADGSIGEGHISISSGKTFEGCGVIDAGNSAGHGAIEVLGQSDVSIPALRLTGDPYFGLWFYGVTNLHLGQINLDLTGGIGIRFERDEAGSTGVTMDSVTVTCPGHGVEVWNVVDLEIGEVIARDVGNSGLLIQNTIDAHVGLVDGENVATGTGYATLRFANRNGRQADGTYPTSITIDRVVSRGGGRGIFCVSESGGAEILEIDLADNGGNAILIENCYNLNIWGGIINGGGEVRVSARSEFHNTDGVTVVAEVIDNTVRESPCGININWEITGNAALDVC